MNAASADRARPQRPIVRLSHRSLLLAGLLLGWGLRLYRLGAESLWYDEAVSAFLARQSAADLIAHTARDIHPPGYYLLLHVWQIITSPTLNTGFEFLWAWPSALCGMILLPLIYALGRRLFDRHIALIALWLTALHPYHIWYSQEVRMYTLGALLGLLCLWATLGMTTDNRRRTADRPSPLLYILAAAAGLYTLYYFAFLLLALNVWIFMQYATRNTQHALHPSPFTVWLLAQFAVLLLWLPWLPTVWRQVTQPPVPPWRGSIETLTVIRETFSALLVGQSPPPTEWIWAGLALALIALAYTKRQHHKGISILTLYGLLPWLLVYLISSTLTPLYHIRYFFMYAAPLPLLMAVALPRGLWGRIGLLGLSLASVWSLSEFWYSPVYRSDDHRGAVSALAEAWRPGDAVLVNAGWVYPVLDLYWPTHLRGPDDARPAPLTEHLRLTEGMPDPAFSTPKPLVTGSVDGAETLGWGLAESDFYAMTYARATAALTDLAAQAARIWHYRLYDTVSDPHGKLRADLAQLGGKSVDQPYPGRDFLRLERYDTGAPCQAAPLLATAGEAIQWAALDLPTTTQAGSYLYVTLCAEALTGYNAGLRTSLRLYRQTDDTLIAQADGPIDGERITLALPIPAATPPGTYWLDLIVYNGADGAPLPLTGASIIDGQRLRLGTLTVDLPLMPPPAPAPLARFDYIELLSVHWGTGQARPGETLAISTLWRPRPNEYRDTYAARFRLTGNGETQEWRRLLGGDGYPSGAWAAGYPVRDWQRLPLSPDLPVGEYTLWVGLERASDGQTIPARRGWLAQEAVPLGRVQIQNKRLGD